MAGFNWFQRGFDTPDNGEAEAKQPADNAPKPGQASPETAADAPQLSPEDYLKWAKAAYQNIQKQQAAAETAEEASPPPESAPESAPESKGAVEAPADRSGSEAESAETEEEPTAAADAETDPAERARPSPA